MDTQEDGVKIVEESMSVEQLKIALVDIEKRIVQKRKLRDKNVECEPRPDEDILRKLDSSLKKNNAFLKKVKTLTDGQKDALIKDFGGLNLSKYVGELASILVEVKLKMSDVNCAVELASKAHQRYAEFAPAMLECWKKVLPRPPTKKDPEPPGNALCNLSKLRVDVRLFAELVSVGVFGEKEGLQVLGQALTQLILPDKSVHNNLSIITSFCKFCAVDYAGFLGAPIQKAAKAHGHALPNSPIFSQDRKNNVRSLLLDYYKSAVDHVVQDFKDLKKCEKRNRRQYQLKGEVFADAAHEYSQVRSEFEKLLNSVKQLGEQVEADPPPLPDDIAGDELVEESGIIVQMGVTRGGDDDNGIWEDEDTRQFYETLPELRQMLPGILYQDSEQATLAPIIEQLTKESAVNGNETTIENEVESADVDVDDKVRDESPDVVDKEDVEKEEVDDGEVNVGDEIDIEDIEVSGDTLKAMMDVYIKDLPNLVNRDLIDKAAVDFVTNLNTKINRKKLVRAIYGVPRTRLDLLPFYARLMAVLRPVMPDVSTEIVQLFLSEMRRHIRKKDQILTESKQKTARMIGELTKFSVCPKSECLHVLKQILFDFRRHNIEMACSLLDSAGYFLFQSPESHQKTKILLEQMMRKRQAAGASLDSRYELMIDNAFYQCCPPPSAAVQRVERPPMQQYINKLIFNDLSKHQVTPILKQLRKLDWKDESVRNYAVECLTACWEVKYSCIQYLASVLAGLMYYHHWIGSIVVDSLLEQIRIGMEVNHVKLNQRRVVCVKYLGEMYNFKVVDSVIIFNTLYSLMSFGVSVDPAAPSLIDPPGHLLRIRLVCTILDTCGEYFNSGSSKIKLDCFITYLLRYYWMKKEADLWTGDRPFPSDLDDVIYVTIKRLRSKRTLYKNLEEAQKEVSKIEEEYREKVESALKFVEVFDEAEDLEEEDGLAPIREDEEDEEDRTQTPEPILSNPLSDMEEHLSLEEDDFDDEVVVHAKDTSMEKTVEDTDFCSQLDFILTDNLQQRVHEKDNIPHADLMVPPNLKAKLNAKARFADDDENDVENEEDETPQKMGFVLMLKGKNSKPTLKNIKVSLCDTWSLFGSYSFFVYFSVAPDSTLAQAWKDRVNVEEEEKQKLKQLTLNITQRMEQEEMIEAEQALRRNVVVVAPRESQSQSHKFQHQRGAPSTKDMYNRWN